MVADLGLLLIELGQEIQQQREAAVILLHLAEVPWGAENGCVTRDAARELSAAEDRPLAGNPAPGPGHPLISGMGERPQGSPQLPQTAR